MRSMQLRRPWRAVRADLNQLGVKMHQGSYPLRDRAENPQQTLSKAKWGGNRARAHRKDRKLSRARKKAILKMRRSQETFRTEHSTRSE